MKAPKFSYVRADSLEQVLELLAEHGEDARILAGGQSLMPTLNMRLSQPQAADRHQPARRAVRHRAAGRTRCASARCPAMRRSPVRAIVARHLPLIAEAMPHVAHVAVRNRGTFGGSIALADPAAEMPACVLVARRDPGAAKHRRPARDGRRRYFRALRDRAPSRTSCWSRCLSPCSARPPYRCSWSWPGGTATSPSPASPAISASTGRR